MKEHSWPDLIVKHHQGKAIYFIRRTRNDGDRWQRGSGKTTAQRGSRIRIVASSHGYSFRIQS